MPRIPIRQQNAPFGSYNPAAAGGRAPRVQSIRQSGPALALEQFDKMPNLDANTARALNQLQQNVLKAVGPSKGLPFANGSLLEGVSLKSGVVNTIAHGLGVAFRNAWLIGPDVQVTHAIGHNTNPKLDEAQLLVAVSADCTADLWVYA
jgi:hypothetical protein